MSPAPPLPALVTILSFFSFLRRRSRAGARGISRGCPAALRSRGARPWRAAARLDQAAHLLQPGVGADRPRLFAHELHAVVVGRIVAGGHHDAPVQLLGEGREVRPFRAPQADVEHIRATVHQAALEGGGQLRAGESDVVADRHAARLDEGGIGTPDVVDERFVDLIRDAAADVVGLERIQIAHARALLGGSLASVAILEAHDVVLAQI